MISRWSLAKEGEERESLRCNDRRQDVMRLISDVSQSTTELQPGYIHLHAAQNKPSATFGTMLA